MAPTASAAFIVEGKALGFTPKDGNRLGWPKIHKTSKVAPSFSYYKTEDLYELKSARF